MRKKDCEKPGQFEWFPGNSPTELKADPFLGTKILQHVPDWLLREAERWPHPWQVLGGARDLPLAAYDLFRAADTVATVLRRFRHMQWKGATLSCVLNDEMTRKEKSGDKADAERVANKVMLRLVEYGAAKNWPPMTDQYAAQIVLWENTAKRVLLKRHGAKGLTPKKLLTPEAAIPLEAHFMAVNWLRWPSINAEDDAPGLCFYSDQALADLMTFLVNSVPHLTGLNEKSSLISTAAKRRWRYQKLRERLGLEQAYYRTPLVTAIRRGPAYRSHGLLQIEVHWKETIVWQPLSPNRTLLFRGRQVYPVPVPA